MPKTTKKFDWEIYDGDECIDILSMTRSEMKEYQKLYPNYKISEVEYTDDRNDSSCETNSKKRRNIYSIRLSRK